MTSRVTPAAENRGNGQPALIEAIWFGAEDEETMNKIFTQAMRNSDDLVVQMEYVDSKGKRSNRIVSPIRFLPGGRLLALCLCRAEPRQFHLCRCENAQLKRSADYVMPVQLAS